MKKFAIMALALTFLTGAAVTSFAQEAPKETKPKKVKKPKKSKTTTTDTTKK